MQQATDRQFWDAMNIGNTNAYRLGQQHLLEAMACHPRITKPMISQVQEKADEIREQWDGLFEVSVDA